MKNQSQKMAVKKTRPALSRDDLITKYRTFVHAVAHRLVRGMGLPMERMDEFISAGYLGLVEAAERYDQRSGNHFKTFAYWRIRGSIIDNIRATADLQGRAYRYARALEGANDLAQTLAAGKRGKVTRTKEQLLADVLDYAATAALAFRLSLGDVEAEVESIEDQESNPERCFLRKEERKNVREALAGLPEKERTIIQQYYFQGRSISDMARDGKKASKSWVSRQHSQALTMLKQRYLEISAVEPA